MGNILLPNNPTLDEIKDLIRKINSRVKIINASVNQEELTIDSPIATIIQSNSTDPGEYTTTDIDTTNFYTKNEINTLLQDKVNSTDFNTLLDGKQNALRFDDIPTTNSSNPVKSSGIKSVLDVKQNILTFDTTPTDSSVNPVTSGGIKSYVDGKIISYDQRGVKGATQNWGTSLIFNARGNGILIISGQVLILFWSSGGGLSYNLVFGTLPAGFSMTRDSNYNITVTTQNLNTITAFWLAY